MKSFFLIAVTIWLLQPTQALAVTKVYCLGEGAYNKASKHKRLANSEVSQLLSYGDLFIGKEAGSMGETCRLVIILGGIFLIIAKVSNWRTPVTYLATVFVAALAGHHFLPGKIAPATFQPTITNWAKYPDQT